MSFLFLDFEFKQKIEKTKKTKLFYFLLAASRLQQLQQMQQFETQQPPQQEFSQQSSKSPVQSQSQQQLQQTTNNINRKLNGFLNLKTPLIGYVLHWPMIDCRLVFRPSSVHNLSEWSEAQSTPNLCTLRLENNTIDTKTLHTTHAKHKPQNENIFSLTPLTHEKPTAPRHNRMPRAKISWKVKHHRTHTHTYRTQRTSLIRSNCCCRVRICIRSFRCAANNFQYKYLGLSSCRRMCLSCK